MHGLIDPYVALLDLLDERARIEFPQASRHFEQLCRAALPLLDQIPGLGDAFGHQDNSTARTELIIFIRPQIIRNSSDAHNIAAGQRLALYWTPAGLR